VTLSLKRIQALTGHAFADGSTVVSRWPNYVGEQILSVDQSEAKSGSPLHKEMIRAARLYFQRFGWILTDTHIGLNGHEGVYRFADFAMELKGKVVLVECLTHWQGTMETIRKKLKLAKFTPIWFVAQPRSGRTLKSRGYLFTPLPPLDRKVHGRNNRIYIARKRLR
jgi:hypothetical protein